MGVRVFGGEIEERRMNSNNKDEGGERRKAI